MDVIAQESGPSCFGMRNPGLFGREGELDRLQELRNFLFDLDGFRIGANKSEQHIIGVSCVF